MSGSALISSIPDVHKTVPVQTLPPPGVNKIGVDSDSNSRFQAKERARALPRPELPFVWAASCGTSLERPSPTFSTLPARRRGRPSSSWSRSSPICRGPRRGHHSMAGAGRRRRSPPEKLLPTGGLTQIILQARIERRESGDWQL